MKFVYQPKGVCSREFTFEIEDGIIKSLSVYGGCNGNLKAISALLKEQKITDIIPKLKGTTCGFKNTSCPDQIARALEKYLEENK